MPEQNSSSSLDVLQKFSIPLAIVLAGAFIAGAVYLSGGTLPASGQNPPSVNIKDVKITATTPVLGDKSAPATLAYWFDYQCPFCKAVDVGGVPGINVEPSMPILVDEYVNTGKLRIVFKDYAFLGPDSTTAALYKHAVWEKYPDRFYEWHEAMYKAQDEENGGFGDEESILTLIRSLGLDANALKALVDAKRDEYLKLIQDDIAEGAGFGINGTPGFITGTTLIPGAEQPATFRAVIDAQL
ncbi:MAG: thioredoxin domain-containing protein [Candidatus Kaiserbacteria bacterium]|nr:MAG: thioredoxin domain-containing protein [Candidatus Kaiserbacteria bacterium]